MSMSELRRSPRYKLQMPMAFLRLGLLFDGERIELSVLVPKQITGDREKYRWFTGRVAHVDSRTQHGYARIGVQWLYYETAAPETGSAVAARSKSQPYLRPQIGRELNRPDCRLPAVGARARDTPKIKGVGPDRAEGCATRQTSATNAQEANRAKWLLGIRDAEDDLRIFFQVDVLILGTNDRSGYVFADFDPQNHVGQSEYALARGGEQVDTMFVGAHVIRAVVRQIGDGVDGHDRRRSNRLNLQMQRDRGAVLQLDRVEPDHDSIE
jgi:hypothetical protein